MVNATNQTIYTSDRRFVTLAQKIPVVIFRTDTAGNCLYVNKRWCEISGLSLKQSLGQGWQVAVHPEELPLVEAQADKILPPQKSLTTEFRWQNPQGNITWVLSESVVEIDDNQQHNQELDKFADIASHDLKAPLRAIASLSEWWEEDLADQLPAENQHQLQLLRGRVRHMEGLINGLLEYSRIGSIHTEISMVNVDSLLQEVIDSLQPPPNFHIEIQSGMPTFITKKVPLQLVFTNLIDNAIHHHTRANGHVKISVRDLGNYYEFTVADDGTGIAVEYHNKIFASCQPLEPRDGLRLVVGDRQENTGIGLAIIKKIVETEGGAITLKPVFGTGSTFRFTWTKRTLE